VRDVDAFVILRAPLRHDSERRRWYADGGDACLVWTESALLVEPFPTFEPSSYRLLASDVSFVEATCLAWAHGFYHVREPS